MVSTARIGMPQNVPSCNKSPSPVTIASTRPATAAANTGRSFGSRSPGGDGIVSGAAHSTCVRIAWANPDGVMPRFRMRAASLGRSSTAANSAQSSGDRTNVSRLASTASRIRAGAPFHREPETSTFVSATILTTSATGTDGIHFRLNLIQCQRNARLGTDLTEPSEEVRPLDLGLDLSCDQVSEGGGIEKAGGARLSGDRFRQIKFHRDAHMGTIADSRPIARDALA